MKPVNNEIEHKFRPYLDVEYWTQTLNKSVRKQIENGTFEGLAKKMQLVFITTKHEGLLFSYGLTNKLRWR